MLDVAIGLGVRPGVGVTQVWAAMQEIDSLGAVRCLATWDRRVAEPGVREAAARLQVPVVGFSIEELAEVRVPHPSARVAQELGTPSVAEAAALLAGAGPLVLSKRIVAGVVLAAAACLPTSSGPPS